MESETNINIEPKRRARANAVLPGKRPSIEEIERSNESENIINIESVKGRERMYTLLPNQEPNAEVLRKLNELENFESYNNELEESLNNLEQANLDNTFSTPKSISIE